MAFRLSPRLAAPAIGRLDQVAWFCDGCAADRSFALLGSGYMSSNRCV
ncbi:hypothetical protein C4K05_0151 [Pseudomonas chlororaphis subsp. aureofaciens]|nr:hypothetical protein C4K14_0158 [Pseudomonas chlororaphis subsp. aureofaciens]AZE14644.1 hypothetical protein C4K09_0151 [Pseudomonas chlororaphis subsp. aureofaciens]AZE20607.1 hypothetical protein C4K08_0148 [Pseudomonas chlororaphis subsp. aureofaciens]AZE33217.1 hypothetical protein C4K06_0152 [Pseudomonas chlororaphis subsp. aureofaciens]AZE39523.1 hypothetical protein C4K05_0151 [Pseudomonas chlororaphis subsp. aureofaciens]